MVAPGIRCGRVAYPLRSRRLLVNVRSVGDDEMTSFRILGPVQASVGEKRLPIRVGRGSRAFGQPFTDGDRQVAQGEIRRLEELRLGALEVRFDADLQLGRHA